MPQLTTRGRSVISAGVTSIVCGFLLGQPDLFRIGGFLTLLPIVLGATITLRRQPLDSTRNLHTPRVQVGSPTEVLLTVLHSPQRKWGVTLAEDYLPYSVGVSPRFVLPGHARGTQACVSYTIHPQRRGRYLLGPLRIIETDPLGMTRQTKHLTQRTELLVLPRVTALPDGPLPRTDSGIGLRKQLLTETGTDDASTRPYQTGDDTRRVHWRSSAKRGELMVRQAEPRQLRQASVVLDNRAIGFASAKSFEWAVEMAASILTHLSSTGYQVRLLTDLSQVTDQLAPCSSLMNSLAELKLGPQHSLLDAISRVSATELVICILGELDPATVHALSSTRVAGTLPIAFSQSLAQVELPGWRLIQVPTENPAASWGRLSSSSAKYGMG